jgi:transcriptional regulator with XRE-family HTH domain
MARAGRALKRVLEGYGISQNQLATTMGIDRSNVSRWVSGSRDPSAEAVAEIKKALAILQSQSAEDFVQYYLYEDVTAEIAIPSERSISSDGNAVTFEEPISGASSSSDMAPMSLVPSEVPSLSHWRY